MRRRQISFTLALGACILAGALALKYAQRHDIVSADTTRRTLQVAIGLTLAAYANVIPKDIGRLRASVRAAARSQSVLRVGGWSLTLAGLGYAGLWAFTPIAFADVAAMVVVAAATLVTGAYVAWTLVMCRRTERGRTISGLEGHV